MRGHALTHRNVRLELAQTLPLPVAAGPTRAPEDTERLEPADKSGAYLLTAALRVADGSSVETMGRGFAELSALRDTLKGVVELEIGGRSAMDTRVR